MTQVCSVLWLRVGERYEWQERAFPLLEYYYARESASCGPLASFFFPAKYITSSTIAESEASVLEIKR